MTILFVSSLYRCLQVAKVIQAVKDTDNINTVCDRFLYKILYHIICIMIVTKNILSTE